jgi:putative ABC transport system permease protein
MNNLMTKKGRTFLTAFAGSIGIIGIALILSLSNGINSYIDRVQEDTLSSYPITIEAESIDMSSLMTSLMGVSNPDSNDSHQLDKVYESTVMYDMLNTLNTTETKHNNLSALKQYLEDEASGMSEYDYTIQYSYDMDMTILAKDTDGNVVKSDVMSLMQDMTDDMTGDVDASVSSAYSSYFSNFSNIKVWQQMLPGENGELVSSLVDEQYDVLAGRWPQDFNEVVLIVDKNNEISDLVLYALGLKSSQTMSQTMLSAMSGEAIDTENSGSWTYDEILDMSFRLVLPSDCYAKSADGTYVNLLNDDLGRSTLYDNGTEIKIVGIVRQSEDAVSGMMSGAIGYTSAMTDYIIEKTNASDIVNEQLENRDTDIITGLPFADTEAAEPTNGEKAQQFKDYVATLSNAVKAEIYTTYASTPSDDYVNAAVEENMAQIDRQTIEQMVLSDYPEYEDMVAGMDDETLFAYCRQMLCQEVSQQYTQSVQAQLGQMTTDQLAGMLDIAQLTDDEYAALYDQYMPQTVSDSTYEDNLSMLGYVDKSNPSEINIYASTFADKDGIADIIEEYNAGVDEADKISYTDYVALLMSSITTIINAISYVLIAFVAISLVVSSIMIGIITYISVLERTKEIGILRAIGASKRDVSRVFNAETVIVGFGAGAIGIIVTLLLCIPANAIIHSLTGISSLNAALPAAAGVILVVISMVLTTISGLIPSRIAAKKDPVVALRTE